MRIKIETSVEDEAWQVVHPSLDAYVGEICGRVLTRELESHFSGRTVEISVLLSNDEEVRALNRQFRNQDKPTNVLSFPAFAVGTLPKCDQRSSAPILLGDLAVAHGTTAAEASAKDVPTSAHLAHLLIHGVLHLLGFDHQDDASAEIMEAKEIAFCEEIGIGNPYIHADMCETRK